MGKHGSDSKFNTAITVIFFILLIFFSACSSEEKQELLDLTLLSDEYLGEPFPFTKAEIFLYGLVDDQHSIQNVAFSRDGKEFYFTRTTLDADSSTIFVSYLKNDFWSLPIPAPFSSKFNDSDPFISYDNNRLYFVSDRPAPDTDEHYFDYNIWYVEREDSLWGEPFFIDEVNSIEDEYSPSVSENGTIYFASACDESDGYWNIYYAELTNGKYSEPRKLDAPINSQYRDFDPYIFKNENKILFASDRPDGQGSGDIYISVKAEDGNWKEPINLGADINTNEYEYSPYLSYDNNF
ncbi:MAG TPA: hypothetical protein ENN33_04100, partial [Ignavibacteria bacterium]|nr:hypothetical protein [Ignavibacteria bacterium]